MLNAHNYSIQFCIHDKFIYYYRCLASFTTVAWLPFEIVARIALRRLQNKKSGTTSHTAAAAATAKGDWCSLYTCQANAMLYVCVLCVSLSTFGMNIEAAQRTQNKKTIGVGGAKRARARSWLSLNVNFEPKMFRNYPRHLSFKNGIE